MTVGWDKRPLAERANGFKQCILEMICYHDRSDVWERAQGAVMTDADIRDTILAVSRPRVFKCAGHICRLEYHDGRPVLYYDSKPLGGPWLIERVREVVGISDGQLSMF